ncbi:N-acetylmuramoyl-L-alanine amidase family protein [Bacillus pseudomycoides]|uniref:N-acetylmuramoyl-L-alanine amidase family protein n=1 Tax=Bacillus pseudomycoides TaxID=64104 RepID=UPI001FB3B33B|nr:cell wall-binding protein [Bacillus pseudomycoides]
MKKKFKTIGIGKKVIPTAAALGILFSVAPIAENKASAGIGTVLDVTITSLGIVKDIYEGLGISPKDPGPGTHIDVYAENITYRAPNFTSGEFNISMHHTEDDSNFTKSVKVLYPNGKIEIHKLRSGQQLKITEAGTIIDLNPDAKSVSEHDLLYITQAQLDEGKTGVVMNQGQTAFVEKTSGKNPRLVIPFHKKRYPSYTSEWSFARGTDALFAELSDEEKRISTLTSKPVSKDVLENYVKNDPKALADFNNRSSNILADTSQILETPITSVFSILNDGNPYQIIPAQKGTNKVIVKKGSKYLSGKEGNALQYSDVIGDDEILELVMIDEKSHDNKVQFHLVNKNGVPLVAGLYSQLFHSPDSGDDDLSFTAKTNNEVHNWLREWYPGKVNEKQKYEGIEFEYKDGEKFPTAAKDSSGNVIKNTWVDQGADYYYAGSDGVFLKGWKEIDGKTYYFHPDSRRVLSTSGSNGNHEIDGKYYHFDDKGALQRSAWRDHSYSDASGAFIKEGLREIEGKIYYFQNYLANTNEIRLEDQNIILHFSDKGVLERASDLNGNALTTPTTVIFNEKQLAFEKNGAIRKLGVTEKRAFPQPDGSEKDAIHYYSLEEGATYSGWKTIDGKKYHFKDGAHYTFDGHETIDGKRYYFNHDGKAKLTGFDKVDGKIYHYDDKGVMQTGWQQIDGKWYYFDDSGAAKIGWFQVGGGYHFPYYGYFTYYATQDGSIYTDTKVEINGKTYKFDSHGHKGY